jgi:hypothetical protein
MYHGILSFLINLAVKLYQLRITNKELGRRAERARATEAARRGREGINGGRNPSDATRGDFTTHALAWGPTEWRPKWPPQRPLEPTPGETKNSFIPRGLAEGCFNRHAGRAGNHVQANKQPKLHP